MYIRKLNNNIIKLNIPIIWNNKKAPNNEEFVSKPIINNIKNNISSNKPNKHKILKT